jgi:hypothetical protein
MDFNPIKYKSQSAESGGARDGLPAGAVSANRLRSVG